jgi:DNA polymerase III sliding clamp (beta) subunit (PCNA family)
LAIDCKKQQLNTSTIDEESFEKFFALLLEPFEIKLKQKQLQIKVLEYHGKK